MAWRELSFMYKGTHQQHIIHTHVKIIIMVTKHPLLECDPPKKKSSWKESRNAGARLLSPWTCGWGWRRRGPLGCWASSGDIATHKTATRLLIFCKNRMIFFFFKQKTQKLFIKYKCAFLNVIKTNGNVSIVVSKTLENGRVSFQNKTNTIFQWQNIRHPKWDLKVIL